MLVYKSCLFLVFSTAKHWATTFLANIFWQLVKIEPLWCEPLVWMEMLIHGFLFYHFIIYCYSLSLFWIKEGISLERERHPFHISLLAFRCFSFFTLRLFSSSFLLSKSTFTFFGSEKKSGCKGGRVDTSLTGEGLKSSALPSCFILASSSSSSSSSFMDFFFSRMKTKFPCYWHCTLSMIWV